MDEQLIPYADENDSEAVIDAFLKGADMVLEEEDQGDRVGVHFGRISAR